MAVKYTELFYYAILLVLFSSLILCKTHPVHAGHFAAPEHHISMEFDLQTGSLQANSRIELPAGLALHLDFSRLNVSQVIINGQPADPDQTQAYLDISPSPTEQEILTTYSLEIQPGYSPYNLVGETGITLIDGWYPTADREMLFKLTAHIPEAFEAVSEADEIITFAINNKKQVTFRFPHPLFSINFIAGPYVVTSESFAEDKNLVAYFFQEDQALAAGYLDKARKYLARYEELLGPYPYNRFAVVENRLPTGFAMPTFTLLGQSVVRLPFIVDTSLGHEVLHAWFGNGIRMSPREGNWVEGLTTYLADQSFAADKGEGAKYRKEQLVKYQSYVRPEMDLVLRNFSNVGHDDKAGQPVRAVGYNKSSMFFHMLRNKIGPEVFTESLRDFYKRAKFKSAGWSDLRTSFESISGLDLKDFFSQWLDRNDVPALSIEQPEIINKEGYPVVHFTMVQKNDTPYVLEVPVVIKTATEEIRKTLSVSNPRTAFDIPMTTVPEALTIDPEYDLMRKLAATELPPTWSRFMGAEKKLAILPSEEYRTLYRSWLEQMTESDLKVQLQDEVKDEDLAENSLIFLGISKISRGLFAQPDHPDEGFSLDVRNNPLDPDRVAVLVAAASPEQVELAVSKLNHYGKYSYLSFKDGMIQEKNIKKTDSGVTVELYRLPAGTETSSQKPFADIMTRLQDFKVIYVGEGHTNYEDHLLQLEIIRALYDHDPRLAIGMEMFTRQTQPVIDHYLAGKLDEKTFLKESHYFKTWRFDYRLYRDIINFAKHNHIPVIALNLEKDITRQVFKDGGPNSLDAEDAGLLPVDRKLDEPGYRERIETAFMMHAVPGQSGDFSSFLQAQALWDETMAQTIAEYLESHPDERMVVIAGLGHVDRNNAIPPRVDRRLSVTQAVVLNSHGSATESDTADFLFFSPPAALAPFPLLGVMLDDTEDEKGVLVKELSPKGRAKEAGIKSKDIMLALDGEPINDMEDLKIEMLYKEESDAVLVRVRRKRFPFGRRELDIEVPLQGGAEVHHL